MIHKRLLGGLIALIVVVLTGIFGYMTVEGWSFFDSLYMTMITIASVGYGEVHPLSHGGRVFTLLLILGGTGALIYGLSVFTAFIVEGELTDVLRRRKMNAAIARLQQHYIVCGISSTGSYVIQELLRTGRKFVVIDKDAEKIRHLAATHPGLLVVEGDATQDATLSAANIHGAEGLLTALHFDADNILVVVTARGLNPRMKIVAKAIDEESERKLRQVGADRVVLPNFIGGLRMASEMIRPSVVTFLDTMLRDKDSTVRVEEVAIGRCPHLCGKTLATSGLLDLEGVSIIAVANGGEYVFNPARQRRLADDDVLIVMGIVQKIEGMKSIASAV